MVRGFFPADELTNMVVALRRHLEDPDTVQVSHLGVHAWGNAADGESSDGAVPDLAVTRERRRSVRRGRREREHVLTALLQPRRLVRLESAVGLALAVLLYERQHGNWLLFLVLILTPDLAMLGYLLGNRAGAACYNAVHTYAFPALLGGVGVAWEQPLVVLLSLIFFAHIAADRLLGYGLKYPTAFKDTHLQRL